MHPPDRVIGRRAVRRAPTDSALALFVPEQLLPVERTRFGASQRHHPHCHPRGSRGAGATEPMNDLMHRGTGERNTGWTDGTGATADTVDNGAPREASRV